MKPDWKDAPEWANYLAQDFGGIWFWYENKPTQEKSVWWQPKGRCQEVFFENKDWDKTLEQRPEQ